MSVISYRTQTDKLEGKYSDRVQLPAKAKFGVFVANTW